MEDSLRYERDLQIVPSSYPRDPHAHVEKDKGHNDVIYMALVTWQKHNGHSSLAKQRSKVTTSNTDP